MQTSDRCVSIVLLGLRLLVVINDHVVKFEFAFEFALNLRCSFVACSVFFPFFVSDSIHGEGYPVFLVTNEFMKAYAERGDVKSKPFTCERTFKMCESGVRLLFQQLTLQRGTGSDSRA